MSSKLLIIAVLFLATTTSSLKAEIVMAMIALEEKAMLDKIQLAKAFNEDWDFDLDTADIDLSEDAITFQVGEDLIGIMNFDFPIPGGDLEGPCKVAYLWPTACKDLKKHKAHLIPTIFSKGGTAVERHILLTKVMSSLLKITKSVGAYIGEQSLVVPSELYVAEAERIKEGSLPIANWVFIGIAEDNNKTTAYTYGLEAFGYREFEVIKSDRDIIDIYELFYNLSNYVIAGDVKINSGETVGPSEQEKIPVKLSSSKFFEGNKVLLLTF